LNLIQNNLLKEYKIKMFSVKSYLPTMTNATISIVRVGSFPSVEKMVKRDSILDSSFSGYRNNETTASPSTTGLPAEQEVKCSAVDTKSQWHQFHGSIRAKGQRGRLQH
jgi:hypothetical protein